MWQKVAKFKGAEYFRKALYVDRYEEYRWKLLVNSVVHSLSWETQPQASKTFRLNIRCHPSSYWRQLDRVPHQWYVIHVVQPRLDET
jgi:hypothetical protein